MKWTTRVKRLVIRFILIIIIVALFYGTFISYVRSKEGQYTIISSSLREKRILLEPGQWIFIPERMIPGFARIEQINKKNFFKDNLNINLPYYDLLKSFGKFVIDLEYSFEYTFTKETLNTLNGEKAQDFLKKMNDTVQADILSRVESIIHATHPTHNKIIKSIESYFENTYLNKAQVVFHFNPDFTLYAQLLDNIKEYSKKENILQKKVFSLLQTQEAQEALNNKKDKLNKYVDSVIEIAKKIKSSGANETTALRLLEYLLDSDSQQKGQTK
jgi:regulator of sigma D